MYLQGNTAVRPIPGAFLEPFRDLGAANLTLANTGSTDHMPFVGVGSRPSPSSRTRWTTTRSRTTRTGTWRRRSWRTT
ncbi:MAG TPA: hypothetical protein VHG28_08040 [Longimicrobiaceae bacterium]|nr:hypothetical protein [Longimicrobiaceae bacterium]